MQPWQRWLERLPAGPTAPARERRHAVIVVEAEDAAGRLAASRVRTPEVYTFTSACASAVVERVLAGELEPGFQTPGRLFGEAFIESFDAVTVEDLRLDREGGGRG
jgi:short subunit dehydrogenase-like uncharacterized protein